ncbi:hypothetical protein WR25_15725 [Diploscapter pachys]|uniref:Myosin motor domain-containing protein n=1 Tax=Diploscapter pachys TaxID=2018661 RepID=A0A2A2J3S1_9BILA|nr:hypothetical protein WR25_15725 [Diploscapter pachys]
MPSKNAVADDLCTLSEPNAATVLDALSKRYANNIIHTYCGLFCVVLNPWAELPIYSKEVMDQYSLSGDNPPHIYTIAQSAYHGILRGGRNQSILITGESGAGKTVNTKKIIDYGKFIRIEFNESGRLQASQIECYLLEKSRVVSQNEGDRNFHIFYQLLSDGFDPSLKRRLKLTKDPSSYKFLNQGGVEECSDIDDSVECRSTQAAFDSLGFSEDEKSQIFELVAACIHVGQVKFGERTGFDMSYVEGEEEVSTVAELLRVRTGRLIDALTQPTIKVGEKTIRKNQNLKKTVFSAAAMAKVIYERLFNYILLKCNDAISDEPSESVESTVRRFIGVLDIAGFEIIMKNSFEQFCINYTNEKLQQFFNHFMFHKEQTEYLEEGIEWTQMNYANDLQPTIDLIEKPLGLLTLLEEECVVPNGGDKSLLEKYCSGMASVPQFSKAKQSQKCSVIRHFAVKHYAGNVEYNIDGWVEKNRDAVETAVLEVLSESTQPLMRKIFPPVSTDTTRTRRGTITHGTVTFVYKNQLQSLLETLHLSAAHFIRCVVPNHERIPGKIDGPLILHQLRCNGVLEGIRICRQGFPSRCPHQEFISRYRILVSCRDSDEYIGRQGAQELCEEIGIDEDRYQIGKTKVFCKVGVISELEKRRRDHINYLLEGLQAQIRAYNSLKECRLRQEKHDAMLLIQSNVKAFASLSNWPWYRLYSIARSMIPQARERERISELEQMVRSLEEECAEWKRKYDESQNESLKATTMNELLKEKCDEAEEMVAECKKETAEYKKQVAQAVVDRDKEVKKIRSEMENSEGIFSVLEKKYNEQHAKVMRMNDALREYERKADKFGMEKQDLQGEINKLLQALENEKCSKQQVLHELKDHTEQVAELDGRLQRTLDELGQVKLQLAKAESETEDERARGKRQNDTISDLQKMISELNDKVARFDSRLLAERNATRKVEREKERLEEELKLARENLEKVLKKGEQLKEDNRQKDVAIKRLERKLEDQEAMMQDCVKELKDIHKERVKDLEQKVEEVKRKNSKLESENQMQKMKRETTFEKESSVDSDYVTDLGRSSSSRVSSLGRQYSLMSVNSFASIRTLNSRRKESDPDIFGSSSYLIRRQASTYDMTQSLNLQRSPSTSQVMEKDRRISELEREKGSLNTDLQLMRRELEVYKASLNALESEKDSLQKQNRKLIGEIDDLQRQLSKVEKNSDHLSFRLKKSQEDSETWKKKHEEAVIESKNEVLAERKRAQERLEASQSEKDLKCSRITALEQSKDQLNSELLRTQFELDRSLAKISDLEANIQSQEHLGDNLEHNYKNLLSELENLRDENCALKAKIRRQYKQIELLTQNEDTESEINHFENKTVRIEEKAV